MKEVNNYSLQDDGSRCEPKDVHSQASGQDSSALWRTGRIRERGERRTRTWFAIAPQAQHQPSAGSGALPALRRLWGLGPPQILCILPTRKRVDILRLATRAVIL